MRKIKGVIYDLDGTIISTQKLHENAWIYAGKKFNVSISQEMLLNQKGISNEATALMMLPVDKRNLTNEFIAAKVNYVNENIRQAKLFPDVMTTLKQLSENNYKVWICTSAGKDFVEKVLNNSNELKKYNVIWREMYNNEKPSPEALNLTIKKMGLINSQVCYVGDALSDYKTSINAEVKFIYFCPNIKNKDARISESIPTISSHKEIFRFLE